MVVHGMDENVAKDPVAEHDKKAFESLTNLIHELSQAIIVVDPVGRYFALLPAGLGSGAGSRALLLRRVASLDNVLPVPKAKVYGHATGHAAHSFSEFSIIDGPPPESAFAQVDLAVYNPMDLQCRESGSEESAVDDRKMTDIQVENLRPAHQEVLAPGKKRVAFK
jgi:hypothetical protein